MKGLVLTAALLVASGSAYANSAKSKREARNSRALR